MCSFETMDKVVDTDTPEEVTTEEENFKAILFLLQAYGSRYGKIFEDLFNSDFVGRYEYAETINGSYELLVRTSSQFGGRIIRGGRENLEMNVDMAVHLVLCLRKQEAN